MIAAGTQLGPYEIGAQIGAGGMGEVYRARDTRLGRTVAVKVLAERLAFDSTLRERFDREGRAIASLNHPHICTLHDVGEHDGKRFLVMEHLEGETLAARMRRERVPFEALLDWAIQVADALAFAHSRHILHRDLKPANLFIASNGAVKILDFGLAKSVDEDAGTMAATQAGMAVGTFAYMSPEQARGERLDGRSDLFSFGAVLYEAAAGAPAFAGATSAVVFEAILGRDAAVRRAMPATVPAGFTAIVERLLAKRASDRFPDAASVASALRELKLDSGFRATGVRVPSIAVLPFADISPQKDHDYFCEGMAEELINALARLPGLRVVSRTSAFRFKGAEDVQKIGRELGVDTILEGSVRTAGTRLRVTAQLVNTADGYHLWSERFDRELDDVFAIQDQIARAIVDALKVQLLGREDAAIVKRAAESVEAYQLCLKARYQWHRWTAEGFQKAFELFTKAVEIDPNCAPAQFGLGDCHMAAGSSGLWPRDSITTAVALIEKALNLDSDLAEAHAILGIGRGLCGAWDWASAERCFLTALKISPRSAHARSAYALHLLGTSRVAEAIAMAREAVALDPLMPSWHSFEVSVQYGARRFDDALRAAAMAIELDGTNWWSLSLSGLARVELGDAENGIASIERGRASGSPYSEGWLGFALAKAGRKEEAERKRQALLEREATTGFPSMAIACVSTGLGDTLDALARLERAVDERDPQLALHLAYPVFESLREEPRFAAVRRRVGLDGLSLPP
jgi:serine/threonine-protein kinase